MLTEMELAHVMSKEEFERLYAEFSDDGCEPDNSSSDWDFGLPVGYCRMVVHG